MATEYTRFRTSEIREILSLCNELHSLPPVFLERARHMLTGIAQLIRAQVSLFSDLKNYRPQRTWQIDPLLDLGWTGAAERKAFMSFFQGDQLSDPLTPLCTKPGGLVVTVLRRQMVEDRSWYRSPNVNELRRAGRLDDCIYSHFRLKEDGRAMGIAFHRPWGDTPFTERERAVVDLVHRSQCLYKRNFAPDENSDAISPRQREVLAVLQAGRSEKEAAIELGLSRHTVHSHVKSIYRRYAVCSRAELMSLWLKRG